jgi:hypothetical protein
MEKRMREEHYKHQAKAFLESNIRCDGRGF